VSGIEKLEMKDWYLVLSNHQSWVDICVLQKVFLGKIPFLKFFLKKELIWVPVMGPAWWALEFPFMKRYSKEFLNKNPHLRGKDIEITKKTCEKFKTNPISIMNFVEGTRFTPEKHLEQNSPYKNLLKPKAGGIAFALNTMGNHLNKILDVTIYYSEGPKTFWEFMCGKVHHVRVDVDVKPITDDLLGDYENDGQFRKTFQNWLGRMWEEKDLKFESLKEEAKPIKERIA